MQLSTLLLTLMASLAIAIPTNTGGGGGDDGDCGCDDGGDNGGGGGGGGGDNGGGGGGGDGGGTTPTPFAPCESALLYSQPQCCSTDALGGVIDLTCATVSTAPSDADDFKAICASSGQTAKCCTLSAVGLSLICADPVGV